MAGFFGFFDYEKPGKGITEREIDKSGISLYFDILVRRVSKLIAVNMLFVLFSIPMIILNGAIVGYFLSLLNNMANGILDYEQFSILQLFITLITILLYGSGPASVGISCVIRKYVNDTHSWVWSDFIDALKSSFFQGLLSYIINVFVMFTTINGFIYYYFSQYSEIGIVFTITVAIVGIFFLLMQMYIYQIMACFKLKIKDIYKNAFILTIVKLPKNILVFGITIIFVYLLTFLIHTPLVLFVFLLLFYSLTIYTQIFMTNNTVKKYIDEPASKIMQKKNN